MVRPNNTTKHIVERYKRFIFPPFGHIPHPMISMFVRHTDKHTEASLLGFSSYIHNYNIFVCFMFLTGTRYGEDTTYS